MRAAADAPVSSFLRVLWAAAAKNLMIALGSSNRAAARDLLDAMRSVADEWGGALLWEQWAKAAFNLTMVHLWSGPLRSGPVKSIDLAAAQALLADMRGVAEKRGEAVLWEQWAKAAGNLQIHLQSRDPAAARALSDEMSALPEDFTKWLLSRLMGWS